MSQCEHHSKTRGDGTWEKVVAPFDCSYYSIGVGGSISQFEKCCTPDDSESIVSGLTIHSVTAPPINSSLPGARWKEGEVITYVRSSSPIPLYFLK